MTATSRGVRSAIGGARLSQRTSLSTCPNCRIQLQNQHRNYADAAVASSTSSSVSSSSQHIPPVSVPQDAELQYKIKSGILLSRPPLITRPISTFEKAFFLYQKRLNERLALPFTRYFYHKKDTPPDIAWKRKVKARNGVAGRDVGGYDAYATPEVGRTTGGWNDEVLTNDMEMGHPKQIMETLRNDAKVVDPETGLELEGDAVAEVLDRFTEADQKNDQTRLDRKLARTLYLCVKGEDGRWTFPSGELVGKENLHLAAERIIVQSCGVNMNTWVVGKVPIGHHTAKHRDGTPGVKTFFLRGRIMAGQADLKDNQFGLTDFKWLTKQELMKTVHPSYFSQLKNMMGER